MDDPGRVSQGDHPRQERRENPARAVGDAVHRPRELRGGQRGVVGDLRVIEAVVAAALAVDEDRHLAERLDLRVVVGGVELEEFGEPVDRVPEPRDEPEKQQDCGEPRSSHGPPAPSLGRGHTGFGHLVRQHIPRKRTRVILLT